MDIACWACRFLKCKINAKRLHPDTTRNDNIAAAVLRTPECYLNPDSQRVRMTTSRAGSANQMPRVAVAGGVLAARQAGAYTASKPNVQKTSGAINK